MQVERFSQEDSGERVSNALVTCPLERDNRSKDLLIPHKIVGIRPYDESRKALREGPASHQLVGEVTAHQGDDG